MRPQPVSPKHPTYSLLCSSYASINTWKPRSSRNPSTSSVRMRPPTPSAASTTTTERPASATVAAAARPAIPAPTMTTSAVVPPRPLASGATVAIATGGGRDRDAEGEGVGRRHDRHAFHRKGRRDAEPHHGDAPEAVAVAPAAAAAAAAASGGGGGAANAAGHQADSRSMGAGKKGATDKNAVGLGDEWRPSKQPWRRQRPVRRGGAAAELAVAIAARVVSASRRCAWISVPLRKLELLPLDHYPDSWSTRIRLVGVDSRQR